jgi:hypothetical protein
MLVFSALVYREVFGYLPTFQRGSVASSPFKRSRFGNLKQKVGMQLHDDYSGLLLIRSCV